MDLATNLIKEVIAPSSSATNDTAQSHAETQERARVSPEELVEENVPGAFPGADEEIATAQGSLAPDESAPSRHANTGAEWTTEEVRPRHLGNEGKPPTAGVGAEGLPVVEKENRNADAAVDEARREDLGQGLESRPEQVQDFSTKERADVPSLNRGISGVGPSGGIHNGVMGAGSNDPLGEGSESPHERQSRYKRSEVRSSISSVKESGLGQGGIHNGVVGSGSHEEDERRRSASSLEAVGGAQ